VPKSAGSQSHGFLFALRRSPSVSGFGAKSHFPVFGAETGKSARTAEPRRNGHRLAVLRFVRPDVRPPRGRRSFRATVSDAVHRFRDASASQCVVFVLSFHFTTTPPATESTTLNDRRRPCLMLKNDPLRRLLRSGNRKGSFLNPAARC